MACDVSPVAMFSRWSHVPSSFQKFRFTLWSYLLSQDYEAGVLGLAVSREICLYLVQIHENEKYLGINLWVVVSKSLCRSTIKWIFWAICTASPFDKTLMTIMMMRRMRNTMMAKTMTMIMMIFTTLILVAQIYQSSHVETTHKSSHVETTHKSLD